ncbi:hypothetical protein HX798_27845 [Pseudomonas putida]|uniref:Uncharacterized protein n=1 Tax=Pseudomonas putida TaxID=303 RepID=A0A7Y7ZGQ5_PSEPU|nr:hypothetical protein [Pseudomonas putida]NWC84068.1 hypothetical protein [Pseudomonas putida]
MSDGEIKMLATVSEAAFTRLYRELKALPERKRVKRLIVLAQIGQVAEMAAMGQPMLPASDLLPSPVAAATAAAVAVIPPPAERIEDRVAKTGLVVDPVQDGPKAGNRLTRTVEEPMGHAQDGNSSQLLSPEAATDNTLQLHEPRPAEVAPAPDHPDGQSTRRARRSGHGFSVSL